MPSRLQIDWAVVDLGKRPDAVIAEELGISRRAVGNKRRELSIQSYREGQGGRSESIDWSDVGLGERPDQEIADELGVNRKTVGNVRHERGVKAFRPQAEMTTAERSAERRRIGAIEWESVGLGERSDAEIAREFNVRTAVVQWHRNRLDIESYGGSNGRLANGTNAALKLPPSIGRESISVNDRTTRSRRS